ncbi:MAG: hypothetical protein AAB370_11040 [Verrucomicrobiota bacterium]
MKPLTKHWIARTETWGGIAALVTGTLIVMADVPQPVLTIAPTGTNQLLISITNGVTNINYEIYKTPLLGDEANYPFTLHLIGELGQSNFTVNMGPEQTGWYRAAIGLDWDNDGVPNAIDGNPNNTNVGALTVTIDSPTTGQLLQ